MLTCTSVLAQTSSTTPSTPDTPPTLNRSGIAADPLTRPAPATDGVSRKTGVINSLMRPSPKAAVMNRAARASFLRSQAIAPIVAGQFVKRSGSMLLLDGREFRFAGSNIYYLQPEIVYNNEAAVAQSLDRAVELGLTVIRSWGFNDNRVVPGGDPAVIQSDPGVFNEANLVALDRGIALAKARNIRLILGFTNNWRDYGGMDRYVEWKLGRIPTEAEHLLFYTDETIKGWYKAYVNMLINRVNTVTGVAYKDDPTIMAWELANEPRARGNVAALQAWMTEMSAYVKSLDSNHLLSDGGEGMDSMTANYPSISNTYAVSGFEGASFSQMVNIPNIDLVSYHFYPTNWGLNNTTDAEIWIRVHQQLARAAGKVAFLGEFGTSVPGACNGDAARGYDQTRSEIYERWLNVAIEENATSGQMFWQILYDARPDYDCFGVYVPTDARTVAVLQSHSAAQNQAAPVTVSSASYLGEFVASDSLASMFGINLSNTTRSATSLPLPTVIDGTSVMVKDALGVERPAGLVYISPGQLNFHVPTATANGGAIISVIQDGEFFTSGQINVSPTAPGLFTADATGQGLAAALILRIKADLTFGYEPVARFDNNTDQWVPVPIDFGDPTDQLFLVLLGTGIRNRDALSSVTATVGGVASEVLYAGAQPDFPGMDQINVALPRSLAGRGLVNVVLKVGNAQANPVTISFAPMTVSLK
ncbi:MAG TPA: cellulase family glycosylhydrolase [Blastocatellia bacterium]|nr:cellulase family glycosylhydrolase [Blastocatellia bacterium]